MIRCAYICAAEAVSLSTSMLPGDGAFGTIDQSYKELISAGRASQNLCQMVG